MHVVFPLFIMAAAITPAIAHPLLNTGVLPVLAELPPVPILPRAAMTTHVDAGPIEASEVLPGLSVKYVVLEGGLPVMVVGATNITKREVAPMEFVREDDGSSVDAAKVFVVKEGVMHFKGSKNFTRPAQD